MRRWLSDWLAAAGLGALLGLAAAVPWLARATKAVGCGDMRPVDAQRSPRSTGEPPRPDRVQRFTTVGATRTVAHQANPTPATCGQVFDSQENAHE